MIAPMATNPDASTLLTGEHKAADLSLMKSHLDVMVTATDWSGAGFGPMGGMMGR